MRTDWFVKVKRPDSREDIGSEKEHIKECSDCHYVIWEKPRSVAGFMNTCNIF